jgi:hypothetical protein
MNGAILLNDRQLQTFEFKMKLIFVHKKTINNNSQIIACYGTNIC